MNIAGDIQWSQAAPLIVLIVASGLLVYRQGVRGLSFAIYAVGLAVLTAALYGASQFFFGSKGVGLFLALLGSLVAVAFLRRRRK